MGFGRQESASQYSQELARHRPRFSNIKVNALYRICPVLSILLSILRIARRIFDRGLQSKLGGLISNHGFGWNKDHERRIEHNYLYSSFFITEKDTDRLNINFPFCRIRFNLWT